MNISARPTVSGQKTLTLEQQSHFAHGKLNLLYFVNEQYRCCNPPKKNVCFTSVPNADRLARRSLGGKHFLYLHHLTLVAAWVNFPAVSLLLLPVVIPLSECRLLIRDPHTSRLRLHQRASPSQLIGERGENEASQKPSQLDSLETIGN